ncbi:putative cysteine-rich receptor-like protein kinase 9 [Corylus avellana]|uniref:putative cysteine-rich receptor-like protein kinase 9 n=1 Tax=Corylus avellana TaxID=13451 RepID=UPI00286A0A5B|nr:putative cysteine-rich receptor-like protein kinase 9 [Corylus avellana]
MVSSTSLLFLLSSIFILTAQAVARPDFLYYFCIHDKGGNSAGNSSYEANFSDPLFSLPTTTEVDCGVSHYDDGQNSDQVYANGFCRGDVNPHACRGFLNDAKLLLTERCPQQKEAIGWYDECMLRYSNRSIRGAEKTSQKFFRSNLYNMSACNTRFEVYPFYNLTTAASPRTSTNANNREAHDRSLIFVIINKFVVAVASVVLIISTGIYVSVKGLRKNDETINEITSTELEAKKNGRGHGVVYERYSQIRKKLSTMIFYSSSKKKDGSFVPPLNQENEIQEAISQPILDGSSSTSELDEYKLRYEEAEREANRQREKISSIEEEVSSLKRQQTQLQQEMEAKQRQLEQQIEFLLSQLQVRRDPPT